MSSPNQTSSESATQTGYVGRRI